MLIALALALVAAFALLRLVASAGERRPSDAPLDTGTGRPPLAVTLAFLLSGAAALVYQVVWQRLLALHSGMGSTSVALIVSAFMAGLGLGSLAGGRLSLRLDARRALLAFAWIELGLAALGAASSWLYYDLVQRLPPPPSLRVAALTHLLALMPPTLLMGASLPFLARGVLRDARQAARSLGTLYAVNVLGAAAGALLAPWVLMRLFGLRGATFAAAAANLAAALLAGLLRGRATDGAREAEAPATALASSGEARLAGWVPLYALSGLVALALEILWFRVFDVAARGTAFTFGTGLALFLLGNGLGSLAGARWAARLPAPRTAFLALQTLILLYAGVGPLLLVALPADLPGYRGLVEYWRGGGVFLFGPGADPALLAQLYLALPLLLFGPPTFLMGLSFPLLQRAVQDDPRTAGHKTGRLQAANILGCVAGSALVGVVALDRLGTSGSLRLLLVAGAAFPLLGLRHGPRAPFALGAAALLAVALGLPPAERLWPRLHGVEDGEPTLVSEDASGLALLSRPRPDRWRVWTGGHLHSGLPYGGAHTLLGALPVLAHPRPRDVAVIGLGSGDSAWAAAARPETERLEVFEICGGQQRLLARLADEWPLPELLRLLRDPRLRLHVIDGRQALARRRAAFDVIEMDPLWPYYAGSGNLYSAEFFELAARSLKPGGVMCSWAPTPRVRATFRRVFPHVLATTRGGQVLLGSLEPLDPGRPWLDAALPHVRAHLGAQTERVLDVLGSLAPVEAGRRTQLNRDLFPRDELALGKP